MSIIFNLSKLQRHFFGEIEGNVHGECRIRNGKVTRGFQLSLGENENLNGFSIFFDSVFFF